MCLNERPDICSGACEDKCKQESKADYIKETGCDYHDFHKNTDDKCRTRPKSFEADCSACGDAGNNIFSIINH